MRELSLFSGAGGGLLGTKLLGWTHCGYVEYDDYCQRVIRQRIDDGILDDAPIFGNIRAFLDEGYADSYQGMVDVVTAGFPCQPFSVAGKRAGEQDDRNMWPEVLECLVRIRPRFAYLENVPGLLAHEYARRIFGDLAESGFDAEWRVLSAAECGAPHKRDRVWILCTSMADTSDDEPQVRESDGALGKKRQADRGRTKQPTGVGAGGRIKPGLNTERIGGPLDAESCSALPTNPDNPNGRRRTQRRQSRNGESGVYGEDGHVSKSVSAECRDRADGDSDEQGRQRAQSERESVQPEDGTTYANDAESIREAMADDKVKPEREPANETYTEPVSGDARTVVSGGSEPMPNTGRMGLEDQCETGATQGASDRPGDGSGGGWWTTESDVGRVADELAD